MVARGGGGDCELLYIEWSEKSFLRRWDFSWDLKAEKEPHEEKERSITGRVNSICKDPEAGRKTWEEVILTGE